MKLQNRNHSWFALHHVIFYCLLILICTVIVQAQNYFPIGAWCLSDPEIDELFTFDDVKGYELIPEEKAKIDNLGLNYFLACLWPRSDQALVNFGVEKNGAFKTTIQWTPIGHPTVQPEYPVHQWSWKHGNTSDPAWRDSVEMGYGAMNDFYGQSVGLHSVFVGIERGVSQSD